MDNKNEPISFYKNCFTLIRLLAALQVAYGHMIWRLGIDIPAAITNFFYFFRGVPIFFALSGYLIWNSVGKSKSFKQYIHKRFWRIYPELWIGIVLELLVIIIFYFDRIEWISFGLFAFGQATVFQFWTPDSLRGFGVGTPNGALWTICVLIQFYIAVWFVYKLLHKKNIKVHIAVFTVSLCISVASQYLEGVLPEILYKLYDQTLIPYFWIFLLGIEFAEFSDRLLHIVKKNWYIFVLLTYLFIFIKIDVQASYPVFMHIFQICAVMGIGYAFPKLEIKTDISYGIYIYHMIVVNIMVTLGAVGKLKYLFIALVISCVLAYISTITIGKWSSKKKKELSQL